MAKGHFAPPPQSLRVGKELSPNRVKCHGAIVQNLSMKRADCFNLEVPTQIIIYETFEVAAMMSTGIRSFFSLGFRQISGECIRVSLRKNSLLRMCANRYNRKNKFSVRKYLHQLGPCG